MPKDYANDPRLKDRPSHVKEKFRKGLDLRRDELLYDAMAKEMDEEFEVRASLPKMMKQTLEAITSAVTTPQKIEVTAKSPAKPQGTVKRPTAPDIVSAAATAEFLRFVAQRDPADTLRELFPDDAGRLQRKAASDLMRKSSASVAETTNVNFGADLVQSDHMGWLSELERVSVFGSIMARGGRNLPMGPNQSITYAHRRHRLMSAPCHSLSSRKAGPFPSSKASLARTRSVARRWA